MRDIGGKERQRGERGRERRVTGGERKGERITSKYPSFEADNLERRASVAVDIVVISSPWSRLLEEKDDICASK